ncbi:hypothetical protein [Bacillus safensis]|uniref:hypothetical protein n=1 Tax=Bacillus safensis TaxID=561879 RepID=UPI002280F37D|nr:hypothetical protein [Bacillus safensis]MCY7675731.1 hypothetical protein [Bacillus safensis]MCY7699776.1 hypothetical protein [Bacillus safensis]MEC3628334.1 hypothetical protein [Bacillus safensis]
MNENNPIIYSVIEKLHKQQEKGLKKYGVEVDTSSHDLKGWLQHGLEETLDLVTYLEAAIQLLEEQVKSKEMDTHALIMKLRERHQLEIYTVDEQWCVHLFQLDICPNDIGISCEFETNGTSLNEVLTEALEWSSERQ